MEQTPFRRRTSFMDRLTEAIAGPTRIRQSQERAVARSYSNATSGSESIRSEAISPGEAIFDDSSSSPDTRPLPSRRPTEGTIPSLRPNLSRSHSEVWRPAAEPPQQTDFPPDITAMELTPEQIKRTYSHNQIWNHSEQRLPPLVPMQGLSRYRSPVNANKQWQFEFARRKLSDLEPCLVPYVENQMGGMTDEEWQAVKLSVLRRDSAISSDSALTDSSRDAQHQSSQVGPPSISRGFWSSTTSSSRSSSKEKAAQIRDGSTASMMGNIDNTTASKTPAKPRARSAHLKERRQSQPLDSITESEVSPSTEACKRKQERACVFSMAGDPESAVASDDEDSEWSDVPQSASHHLSTLTKALKESAPGTKRPSLVRERTTSSDRNIAENDKKKGLDRSRTLRVSSKAHLHRKHSRSTTQKHSKRLSLDLNNTRSEKETQDLPIRMEQSTRKEISDYDLSPPMDLLLEAGLSHQACNLQDATDDTTSVQGNIGEVVLPSPPVSQIAQRDRSCTVIRIRDSEPR